MLDKNTQLLYWRHPAEETIDTWEKFFHPIKGPYLYFRRIKSNVLERLTQLTDPNIIPHVFLHGSAHIDNYAQTLQGGGIVDFDRSCFGPYYWDMICSLLAIALRFEQPNIPLPQAVINAFYQSYLDYFSQPNKKIIEFSPLTKIKIKKWEKNTLTYLAHEKKWAKKIKNNILPKNDPFANSLLKQFLTSQNQQDLLNKYQVTNIALAEGSFGRIRFLFVLQPNNKKQDTILFDIKQTRDYRYANWSHCQWFTHQYKQQGERMIASAQLYTSHMMQYEGFASINGLQFWGRQIPTLNRKPNKIFTQQEQMDFALTAGSQLGRGHRLSLQNISSEEFIKFFNENFSEYIEIITLLQQEISTAWKMITNFYK